MDNKKNLLYKLTEANKYLQDQYKNIDTKISSTNTLFILDWDDTLFPTSWISKNNIDLLDEFVRGKCIVYFRGLDTILSQFLKNISQYGNIVIITNALTDWVKLSSVVLPKTYNIVKNIHIVSARNLFSQYSNEMMDWKKQAFKMVIDKEYTSKPIMNIISIGDAEYEQQALVELTKHHPYKIKYLKSFRMMKEPQYEQIMDQLNVLNNNIPYLWNRRKQICKTFLPL